MPSLFEILIKLTTVLNQQKVPYMLVGGLAVNYYGAPRTTGDIDISVLVNSENIKNFLSGLRKKKFVFHAKEVLLLAKTSNRFLIFDPSNAYRVDCWMPKTGFELQALNRRVQVKIGGKKIFLPSAEDLVLFKLLAGREKDQEDLKWIVLRQKKHLDKKYLKFWSVALGVHKDLIRFMKEKKSKGGA
jgi:predicted nucleotidyltransferase